MYEIDFAQLENTTFSPTSEMIYESLGQNKRVNA